MEAEHVGGTLESRNLRSLVPPQMNHKRIEENSEDFCDTEPDYMFVVKKNREKFLEMQLQELNLKVKIYPCKLRLNLCI